jgi:hypothetical protein
MLYILCFSIVFLCVLWIQILCVRCISLRFIVKILYDWVGIPPQIRPRNLCVRCYNFLADWLYEPIPLQNRAGIVAVLLLHWQFARGYGCMAIFFFLIVPLYWQKKKLYIYILAQASVEYPCECFM